MKPYRLRRKILQVALQSITREGMHAFRVEDIARKLRMSKRTFYQLFPTRANLVENCVREINEVARVKIAFYTEVYEESPLWKTLYFLEKYVEGLYETERIFWEEFRQSVEFKEFFEEIRQEWQRGSEKILNKCKQKGYIRSDIDVSWVSNRLLTGLFEARLAGEPREYQSGFYYIMLRGVATDSGRLWLERNLRTAVFQVASPTEDC